jgi:hypothetical protein
VTEDSVGNRRTNPIAGSKPASGQYTAWLLLAVVTFVAALLPDVTTLAQDLTDEKAVEAAKESFSGRTRYPYYDRQQDDVRQLNVEEPATDQAANRKSKWTGKNPKANTRTGGGGNSGSFLGPVLQGFGLAALVIFIGLIAYLIARAFLKNEVTETKVSKVIETSRDVDKVQALPFQLRKPTSDFLAEAQRLYAAGNYSEAVIYLYSHLLVQLDTHHVIRLAKGKTNRQYLRETRSRPALREILERTMIAFEDVFFGHHTLSREEFEACWSRVEEFHGQLEKLERAAA